MASCETEPGSSSQKRRRPFITSSSKHDAPLPPPPPTKTHWSHEYDTIRRHHLFEGPPKDHTAYPALQAAVDPHIESFNKIFDEGGLLEHAIEDIGVKTYLDGDARTPLADRNKLKVWFEKAMVGKPLIPDTNKFSHKNREIMPAEARERKCTYRAEFHARITYQINDGPKTTFQRVFGRLPVMVKSKWCHIGKYSPAQLVRRREEAEELGGYFIVNGIEKVVRLLILNRRNFPMAVARPSFKNRGPTYTEFGVLIRSTRPDETSHTNVLHYLSDGNIIFRFSWRKSEYQVPVMMILKALIDTNDLTIFESLAGKSGSKGAENGFLTDRIELLLREYKKFHLFTKRKTRAWLGKHYRVVMKVPDTMSHEEVGTEWLRKVVLVHLGNVNVSVEQDSDKFRMLIFMMRKLYALVAGDCTPDNPDAVQNQEVLVGGFLYGMILKERLEDWLQTSLVKGLVTYFKDQPGLKFTSEHFEHDLTHKIFSKTNYAVGAQIEYFLSTGNLASPTGLDLQQTSGFSVHAEKLNFLRFISHFRMVHRGAFFAQMKTTTVRKLLPESWGFLCPVHTPDGAPCGLLNHLAHKCIIVTSKSNTDTIPQLLAGMGIVEVGCSSTSEANVVQLDGRILGWCTPGQALTIAHSLRHWKVQGLHGVPTELEIGYIPKMKGGQYPGIYIASLPARMIRPVTYLPLDMEDMVGSLEQPYMAIAVTKSEIISGEHTHVETSPTNILSILANMTPFSDFNQSPRNMYQCQMGKQTMGTPGTALKYRADNKIYRLQTGQTPIVRAPLHNEYGFDNFPNGMNAVVAVISYTGYDMDDAMIINKSAHERGFAHGTIYKTKEYDLNESKGRSPKSIEKIFGWNPGTLITGKMKHMIGPDGLPFIGRKVTEGDQILAWHDVTHDSSGKHQARGTRTYFMKYKESETAFIEEVRLLGHESGNFPNYRVSIKFRISRSPFIGDKFSSRHGQKGVLSYKWPNIDMPFSETGIQPDIIINPHAFPSRMTIGMFIESLAGKAGALHGLAQDSTPFRFDEENTAGDYFGEQLRQAGFNFHGNEPMYSGITGEELAADIYMGVVYYQRLRHMVNDKYQVRTRGPVVFCTGQPVKGRQRGGGIRVGEMERDSLLAHGTAFLLQDRLMNCSDYQRSWICRKCGMFLSCQPTTWAFAHKVKGTGFVRCRRCAVKADSEQGSTKKGIKWEDASGQRWVGGEDTTVVAVPGVLKYLDVELAAMGVGLRFRLERGRE